jgi:signal transduction histidine kinase
MPDGGKLTIRARRKKRNVILTVKDTGTGIPETAKANLFTPLFTTKSKGQGFGLAVVKRMTEALGGTVTFESEEGKGAEFTIRLPQEANRN